MAEYYRDLPPGNEEFEARKFRTAVFGFSTYIGVFTALIYGWPTIVLLNAVGDSGIGKPLILIASAILYSLVVLGSYLLYDAIYPLRVGPAGIATFNGFGIVIRVRWKDIREAKIIPFGPRLRFAYLKHGKNVLTAAYVPLYLRDYPAFKAAVSEFAGPDHPLTLAL